MKENNPFETGMMAIAQPRNKQITLLMHGKLYPVLDSEGSFISVRNERGEKRWYKHTNFATTLERSASLMDIMELMVDKADSVPAEAPSPLHHPDWSKLAHMPPLSSEVDMGIDEVSTGFAPPAFPPGKQRPRRMNLWERIKHMFGFGWI